jgi:hypothetical protein
MPHVLYAIYYRGPREKAKDVSVIDLREEEATGQITWPIISWSR